MLIAFDLDGTLIDSARDLADSTNDVLVSYGADPLAVDVVAAMVGDGARTLIGRALDARGVAAPIDDALGRFLETYNRRLLVHTRPYPGIVDAVDLAARGARVALLTNKPEGPARRLLKAFGLADRFQWVVGGDGPFPRKPDPEGLTHLMTSAGVTPDRTLLVGDSPIDVETARRAGVALCLARYGFGHRTGIVTGSDDFVVDDPPDMADAVRRFLERGRP